MKNLKKDNEIMEKLGVTELSRVIGSTNKGWLTLQLRKGSNEYNLVLDAVPLEADLNKELIDLIFPPKVEVQQVLKDSQPNELKEAVQIQKNIGKLSNMKPQNKTKVIKTAVIALFILLGITTQAHALSPEALVFQAKMNKKNPPVMADINWVKIHPKANRCYLDLMHRYKVNTMGKDWQKKLQTTQMALAHYCRYA